MLSLFPQITVDTTAPLPGVVSDSEQSEPEVDFQQGSTQHASWQGFFDRESGVMFYQFAFSDHCLMASDFSFPPTEEVRAFEQITLLNHSIKCKDRKSTLICIHLRVLFFFLKLIVQRDNV